MILDTQKKLSTQLENFPESIPKIDAKDIEQENHQSFTSLDTSGTEI
jgi:hypothetical protein